MAKENFTKYTCDICGKEETKDVRPKGWASIELRIYDLARYCTEPKFDICIDCMPLEKEDTKCYFSTILKKVLGRVK